MKTLLGVQTSTWTAQDSPALTSLRYAEDGRAPKTSQKLHRPSQHMWPILAACFQEVGAGRLPRHLRPSDIGGGTFCISSEQKPNTGSSPRAPALRAKYRVRVIYKLEASATESRIQRLELDYVDIRVAKDRRSVLEFFGV
jgi:hypothetical protein